VIEDSFNSYLFNSYLRQPAAHSLLDCFSFALCYVRIIIIIIIIITIIILIIISDNMVSD